jgi:hypothetical protein
VDDWREIKTSSIASLKEKYQKTTGRIQQTMQSHLISGVGMKEYLSLMFYELRTIRDYILQKMPPNSIAVILGDHQPPIVTNQNSGFDTPLHIISKDRQLLNNLSDYQFVPGFILNPESSPAISHAGIYSLLVRILTQTYSNQQPLPPYLPDGSYLSIQKE